MIGFFVLPRLSVICLSRYLFSEGFCDWSAVDHPFMRKGEKGNLDQLIAEEGYTWPAYWFPPSLPPFYPSIPLSFSNTLLMSPLPTDPPPATVSQGSLCPSPGLLGRRFLPRPRGTRHILLQPAQEKEKRTVTRYEWNQICLTCPAAMTIFHADRECQDWVNGMQLLTVHLTDL